MKKIFKKLTFVLAGVVFIACSEQSNEPTIEDFSVPAEVAAQIAALGFDVDNQVPIIFDKGYLVEGDIYLTDDDLNTMSRGSSVPNVEQYRTNNLVCGPRVITMYADEGGRNGYSPAMIAGLDLAIARYNSENLSLTFERISTDNADIRMTRLKKGEERRGILGSAGFPTSGCDPYGEIKMSGILESSYNLSVEGIATIIAHEMGHCIGFRHTDYFDRSISCGSGGNEGDGGVGAIHIPGTPTGASVADLSWMLSCTDGGDRPFNSDDKVALDYLY
ncbi:M57 family metalloprotease [Ekhidna sp.]|uniref:M57 family metalloprotease n=1 Tax=Ekhidna sp. TaxID=2608089 RepID=UPI003296D245